MTHQRQPPFPAKIAKHFIVKQFPRTAGTIVSLLGLAVLISWFEHWTMVIQMQPNLAPMKFNTALCFIFCGVGLILFSTRFAAIASWLGGMAGLFGCLTLAEYLTKKNFFIDQLFMTDYLPAATAFAGRMSPLAACCFSFLGAAFVFANLNPRWKRQLTAASLCATITTVIALVALCGYIFGIRSAYGWGAYTCMAVHTALAFALLGGGLLTLLWQRSRKENYDFARWLPVTASLTLMAMVGFVSAVNMDELKTATLWRKHTIEVILAAQNFENNLIDIQRGMRGYVTMGDTNALAAFEACSGAEPAQINYLQQLTIDNRSQQVRLKKLTAAMAALFDYDNRTLAAYKSQGADAVLRMDKTGESRAVFGNARDALKAFSDEERRLLEMRDATEQVDYFNAEHLLVFGAAIAAILLILSNLMASREIFLRHRIEAKLNETLSLQNAIFQSTDYGVVSTNPEGIVQTFNPAAERLLGYAAQEIVGKTTPMLWRDPQEIAERAQHLSAKLGIPVRASFEAIAKKVQFEGIDEGEWTFIRKDGSRFSSLLVVTALENQTGNFTGFIGIFRDISRRKEMEAEREKLIIELREALAQVKTLSGLIPICGWCKSVRNDSGYWQTVEQYVRSHSDATFTHGICPACQEKFKADILRANGLKTSI